MTKHWSPVTWLLWIAIILALLTGGTRSARAADKWDVYDVSFEVAFAALVVVDYGQTRWALSTGTYEETNPFLGTHPSKAKLGVACLGGIVGHAIITHFLPAEFRIFWQGVTLTVEAANVHGNAILIGTNWRF